MKKGLFIVAALLIAMMVQSRERIVFIRGDKKLRPVTTEVTSIGSDTLIVTPDKCVKNLVVSLRDYNGDVVFFRNVAVPLDCYYTVITPELPKGNFLEVKDDRGYVYIEKNN